MEKLWSPWRSNYIESFKNKNSEKQCIFCDIAKQKIEDEDSLKIYQGKNCYAVLNLYPYNSGHLLVIPNLHIASLYTLDDHIISEIIYTIKLTMRCIEFTMAPQGFNIGANLGKAAGAGIDEHLHFHIIPRWNGDTNFMPVIGNVKIISQDLLQTKLKLVNAISEMIK